MPRPEALLSSTWSPRREDMGINGLRQGAATPRNSIGMYPEVCDGPDEVRRGPGRLCEGRGQ